MPVIRSDKSKGNYTSISNEILRDKELSAQARFMLCLMLSLPENWKYSASGLATISGVGIGVVKSALRDLEKKGYLIRRRLRSPDGRLGVAEYEIHERPIDLKSNSGSTNTPKNQIPTQADSKQVHPTLVKSTLPNKDSIKTQDDTNKIDQIDALRFEYRSLINKRINFNRLATQYDDQRVDALVELMLDEIICENPKCIIGKKEITREQLRDRFWSLNEENIKYVLDCLAINTSNIHNIRAYLLTCLYNSPTTMEYYYDSQGHG